MTDRLLSALVEPSRAELPAADRLPRAAIDFAGDHWLVVEGEPEKVADLLHRAAGSPVKLNVADDGRRVYVFPGHVRCVSEPR